MRLPTRSQAGLLFSLVLLANLASPYPLQARAAETAQAQPGAATVNAPSDPVIALLATLSPQERIGQLFLTTFEGSSAAPDSEIGKLIREHHIGGVILSSVNRNFVNSADTPRKIAALTNELQARALEGPRAIPMFVALDHEGDGYPYTRVTGGLTPLPNAMTIGATWNPANAGTVGEIAGRELSALGFNLLLGPGIDVLYNPHPTGRGDIGIRSFGGDPWWVARMGQAYICGVHRGSQGRIGTVAKHFPGHGGSDRLPDREIATVDKSLSELKRIELPPFFAVTQTRDECAMTDAMMTSHIRYRGLQGNMRQFTAPISFDAESLGSLLGLPEFTDWRARGLIVSDALGVPAVAKYFDPTERNFPHRQVAREALMAGNDVLSIDQFARPQAGSLQLANLADTINYFQEEYQANAAFRERVDQAAERVLRLKFRLYGGKLDSKAAVMVQADAAAQSTGKGTAAVNQIARDAVTLIHPLGSAMPAAPRRDEDILIFTDAEKVRDCRDCEWYEALPLTAVQDTILRLYGPTGTGQIDPARIHSVSFQDLKTYLARLIDVSGSPEQPVTPTPAPGADITALLSQARWIVFAMRNVDRDATSDAVRVFLDSGDGRLGNTKVVVLAFNAPYYLDTTEINKLNLFLAAYSKTSPSVEAAVRAVFGEYVPNGHPPVNVEGISYDLLRQLAPDPTRPVKITQLSPAPGTTLQAPTEIRVQAGSFVDRNGHSVPDGTEVSLEVINETVGGYLPPVRAVTANAQVEFTLPLAQAGNVVLAVRSADFYQPNALRLVVQAPPTPTPTITPTPSPTLEPTATLSRTPQPTPEAAATATASSAPTATQTVTPVPAPAPAAPPSSGRAARLLLALFGTAAAAALGVLLLGLRAAPAAHRVRWVCLAVSGGMLGYILYLLVWPFGQVSSLAAGGLALAGGLAALPLARRPLSRQWASRTGGNGYIKKRDTRR